MLTNTITRPIEIGLRVVGIWPDAAYTIASRLFWTTTMLIAQIFQYRHVVLHCNSEDLEQLMDGLSATLSYSLLFVKLIVFWTKQRYAHIFDPSPFIIPYGKNRFLNLRRGATLLSRCSTKLILSRIFNDVLARIATDWKECEGAENCGNAWYNMSYVAGLSQRFSNLIIGLHSIAVMFYGIGVVVLHGDNDNPDDRELFLKMELPFESGTSPVYELVMTTQFLHQITAATVIGVLSALLVTLVLHAGGQIDILRENLLEILPKNQKPTISMVTIGPLIRRHQNIIIFTEKIEDLYSYIALAQFISNTLVICCLGFIIVNSIGAHGSSMLVRSLLFYIVINLEAFIFCFAGEYLSIKSKMIGDAAYESLWYNLTPNESRILLFLIMRSQKQLTITVGRFTNLSLQQFANIIKSSASYVSVLHAL
ncbi:odorant receptor 82a-like isoform X1 [Anoplolepis gracilipes]|uniref:odorant receptor 82a-like isoform X1 n=1 Tax=Anoplolepis gracilipes TaxID=354296 RepID=UPI003BA0D06C